MFTPAVKRSVVFAAVTFVFGATAFADELVAFATGGYASGLRTPEMMHKIDADGDGKVSKAEWQAYHEKLFAMMDADHSGALETQEFMHPKQDVASFATGGAVPDGVRCWKSSGFSAAGSASSSWIDSRSGSRSSCQTLTSSDLRRL